jgi:iron complex transport system substrate-binding protein
VRIVSLLPSATETIARLGIADSLVGRSNECTYPAEVTHLPVVTAARIDPRELESVEIDRQVRAAIADGRSLYAVDAALIDELRPDVIVTQDLCAVCAVSSGELGAEVISLDPTTLDEVAASIGHVLHPDVVTDPRLPLIELQLRNLRLFASCSGYEREEP